MRLLAINGSPRAGGNTDLLLAEAVRGGQSRGADTETIALNALSYAPCQECEGLAYDRPCVILDDMQSVYEKIAGADAIVLGSPVFFGSVSAQVKMMVDRFQCAWVAAQRRDRIFFSRAKSVGFIAVASSAREDFFAASRAVVRNWAATIGGAYREELFCAGLEEKGSVRAHPEYLERAFEMGRKLSAARG